MQTRTRTTAPADPLSLFEAGEFERAFAALGRRSSAQDLAADAALLRRCLPDALAAIGHERKGAQAAAMLAWRRVVDADPDWTWAWGRLWHCALWVYAADGKPPDLLRIRPHVDRPADPFRDSFARWSGLPD